MKETVFFIEDDTSIHSLLKATLELDGLDVEGFKDDREFFERLKTKKPDLLVLDLMLPGMSGYEILDTLKSDSKYKDIPVIILSALADEVDVVKGLNYGAVDYIGKPFGILEFMSRVRSSLRKSKINKYSQSDIVEARGIVIDKSKVTCTVNDKPVALTAKEFELLTVLIENKSHVMTRSELLRIIWDFTDDIETRTLDMHIKTLRDKLAKVSSEKYIETVRSVGYVIYDDKNE
ncbi:MAG: response regulator transcription factor [Eubacteriales bacterium]|nr:response regulator transcription factor [Christensenellaceae bacterium]MDD6361574.1 response regulator transcription factor [Christensenellaceae bacterium]MDD7092849.1 response regulator transcription factor [Christensenellaceae bacterium]MDY3240992.1 response regulator transcription factor [Eubacteriales bacterium]